MRHRVPVRGPLRPPDRARQAAGRAPPPAPALRARAAPAAVRDAPPPDAAARARADARRRPPARDRPAPRPAWDDDADRAARPAPPRDAHADAGADAGGRAAARPCRAAARLRAAGVLSRGGIGVGAGAGGRGVRRARAAAARLLRRARAPRRRGGRRRRARPGDGRGVPRARRRRLRGHDGRRLRLGDEGVRRPARHPRGPRVRGTGARRDRSAGLRPAAGPARRRPDAGRLSRRLPPRARSGHPRRAPGPAPAIPELELLEVGVEREICCGSAGVYNLVQPEAAAELGARKARHLLDTGAQAIAAGNPGCAAQLDLHLRELGQPLPIHHPVELVWRSIRAGAAR